VIWAGWLMPYDRPFHLIVDPEKADEINHELRMIGLDTLEGYWAPSIVDEWKSAGKEIGTIPQVTVDELDAIGEHQVVDVRGASEFANGHIPGSQNVPVGYVAENVSELPADRPLVFQCQTGRRSSIAASVAAAEGRTDVFNLVGGFSAWEEAGREVKSEREPVAAAS
jgi:hydroxyacylglutathione hydrolase